MAITLNYTVKEKRDFSPFFDLHFVVQVDADTTKGFSFPLYDPAREFTEAEYMEMIKAEMEYEVGLMTAPPVENTPTPLEGF